MQLSIVSSFGLLIRSANRPEYNDQDGHEDISETNNNGGESSSSKQLNEKHAAG